MVGVAGGSKGCKTCRKRKIKCSQEKPQCNICLRSNRICEGYQRERVFIQDKRSKPHVPSRPSNSKIPNSELTSNSTPSLEENFNSILRLQSSQGFSTVFLHGSITTRNAYTSLLHLTPSARAVYREQILQEFLYIHKPPLKSELLGRRKTTNANGDWFSMVSTLPEITTALESSILSICIAKLGRVNNDPHLVRESLKFYTQGLWELQKALWDEKLMYKDETAAACMALIIYEVLECPEKSLKGCVSHMKGCNRLFELRGPRAYGKEFGHQLFVAFMQMEIQQALAERRSTFLSKPEWSTYPWIGYHKTLHAQLLELTASLASTVATGYQIFSNPSSLLDPAGLIIRLQRMINESWALDAQLYAFFLKLEKETLGPIYWSEPSKAQVACIGTENTENVFPDVFAFSDLRTAQTCMLYWATLSILWSGMGYLYGFVTGLQQHAASIPSSSPSTPSSDSQTPPPSLPFPQLPPLTHRTNVAVLAKNICRSFEFCIQDDFKGAGLGQVVLPMKVAIETLNDAGGCEKELRWAKKAMDLLAGGGIRILNHFGEMTEHAYIPG
ncbi:hypothetical protein BGZ60DRAFT_415048 [Tricladium varicosporioides]|nr:hypothetical protein BGZ60DRAFT_415048 [Hymenoscyphus varicosporioides]